MQSRIDEEPLARALNVSDEGNVIQMKKATFLPLAALMLCLCIALLTVTAFGENADVTIEQMLEANTNEKLFQQSDSILFLQEYPFGDVMVYRTKDFKCHTTGDDYYEAYLDGRFYCSDPVGCYAALGCFPMAVPLEEELVLNKELTLSETLVEVKEDGDRLVLTTVVVPEKVQQTMEYFHFEYTEGDSITYEYILDAETLLYLEGNMTITGSDGTVVGSAHMTLTMDAQMPEQVETLYNRLTAENQKELTIILNPGTEQEEAYHTSFVDGDEVYVVLPEGYTTFYTDAECTQVLVSGEGSAFIRHYGTLYSVKN